MELAVDKDLENATLTVTASFAYPIDKVRRTAKGPTGWIPVGPSSPRRYWMSSVKVLVVFLMFWWLFDITRFVNDTVPTAGP